MTGDRATAFAAATLLLLQDAPIDMTNFYSGDMIPYFGIFDSVGGPLKTYYALLAASNLLEITNRLPVQMSTDLPGLIAACGISDDASRATLLLVNHGERYQFPSVILAGQPLAGRCAQCRMISCVHDLATWPVEANETFRSPLVGGFGTGDESVNKRGRMIGTDSRHDQPCAAGCVMGISGGSMIGARFATQHRRRGVSLVSFGRHRIGGADQRDGDAEDQTSDGDNPRRSPMLLPQPDSGPK